MFQGISWMHQCVWEILISNHKTYSVYTLNYYFSLGTILSFLILIEKDKHLNAFEEDWKILFQEIFLHNALEFKLRLIHNHIKLFFENYSLKSTTTICSIHIKDISKMKNQTHLNMDSMIIMANALFIYKLQIADYNGYCHLHYL